MARQKTSAETVEAAEHSEYFARVKKWYDKHFWKIKQVHNAVVQGWITADEYKEITGEEYVE